MDLSNYQELSLREMQIMQLNVLLDVDKICRKNGIKYFLMFGTLLGAIRHQAFIPWDYDIDIGLLRSEHDKLVEILKKDKEFNEKYFILDGTTDKNFFFPMTKIVVRDTLFIAPNGFITKYTSGIHIDLFAFEVQKMTEEQTQKQFKKKKKLILKSYYRYGNVFTKSKAKKFVRLMLKFFLLPYTPKRILKKLEKLITNSDAPLEECMIGEYCDISKFMPGAWFSELIEVPFEGHMLPVPKEYVKILKSLYNDYMVMTPVEKRVTDVKGFVKKV